MRLVASENQVNETLQFVAGILRSSAVGMVWVDQKSRMTYANQVGMGDKMMQEYLSGMFELDPLSPSALIDRKERIALFPNAKRTRIALENTSCVYRDYLQKNGIIDEICFSFWEGDEPIAVIGAMKREGDPPLGNDIQSWELVQRYVEHNLQQHPYTRQARRSAILARRFGLTARELEISRLLETGATNVQIAYILGISVATVKCHIVNILDKCGVQNRVGIVAVTNAV